MNELLNALSSLAYSVAGFVDEESVRRNGMHEVHMEQWAMQKASLAELDKLKKELKGSQMSQVFGQGPANG